MLKTLGIITCWYGPFPWYFPYFVHSCGYNPTVDFIIITDNLELIPNKPQNVIVVYRTLDNIIESASEKFGFRVNIDYPYKLCDFKPAYGFIFPEIIEGYDYWGQSDLDIIYGNIRDFMTEEMLCKYDFISIRHDYTTGCFALYKNTNRMNTFFMRSKDYRTVLSNSDHYCFDECNFAWDALTSGSSILELNTPIESFTELIKKAELNDEINVHFDFILMEGVTGRVVFDNGRIIFRKQFEAILYHLFWLKKTYNPQRVKLPIPDNYWISPTRIYHSRKQNTINFA